jgi:hypothetical protein
MLLLILMFTGGMVLQYDLNHWLPILAKNWPETFHVPHVNLFPGCFIVGIFIFWAS